MKTNINIVCPNKATKEWRTLVDAIGEPRAYLSFFRNHDSIPSVEVARTLLGEAAPAEVAPLAKPLSVPEPKSDVLKQTLSKSKKPKVTALKIAPRFHGVVLSEIERENLAILFGQTRHRSGKQWSVARRCFISSEPVKNSR